MNFEKKPAQADLIRNALTASTIRIVYFFCCCFFYYLQLFPEEDFLVLKQGRRFIKNTNASQMKNKEICLANLNGKRTGLKKKEISLDRKYIHTRKYINMIRHKHTSSRQE